MLQNSPVFSAIPARIILEQILKMLKSIVLGSTELIQITLQYFKSIFFIIEMKVFI